MAEPTIKREELLQQMQQLTFLIQSTRLFNILVDTFFLFANLFLLLFIVYNQLNTPIPLPTDSKFILYISFILLSVLGIFLSAVWISSNLRFQMFLKLRYFQYRSIERLLGKSLVPVYGDENQYFARPPQEIQSLDQQEVLLNNFTGVAGRLKSFPWSWILPVIFFAFYFYILVTLSLHCVI